MKKKYCSPHVGNPNFTRDYTNSNNNTSLIFPEINPETPVEIYDVTEEDLALLSPLNNEMALQDIAIYIKKMVMSCLLTNKPHGPIHACLTSRPHDTNRAFSAT